MAELIHRFQVRFLFAIFVVHPVVSVFFYGILSVYLIGLYEYLMHLLSLT
jgi:hypothetical protein